jgi:arylsulfatase A-like enzyme
MQADPQDEDKFPQLGGTWRIAAEMMLSLDRACGQFIDKLKSLGLDNSTLVIFANDNGGPRMSSGLPCMVKSG